MKETHLNDFDIIISSNYILKAQNKLGSGSFGDIYLGVNIKTNEKIAIKVEPQKAKNPKIKLESKIYSIIQGGSKIKFYINTIKKKFLVGIPIIYFTGKEGKYNIMIMELLGDNLEKIYNENNRNFSLKTICEISNQSISLLEYIHNKKIIHRDVKPENLLIGINNKKNTIYLIDYGLSKKYITKTGYHIPYIDGKKLIGTVRYISVNTHLGIEQSRRDDLESLSYSIIYFLKGKLPWMGLKAKNKEEKYEKIMEVKINCKLSSICEGIPKEFALFLQYNRDLGFDEKPNYNYLRKIIDSVLEKNKGCIDGNLNLDNSFLNDNNMVFEDKKKDEEEKRKKEEKNVDKNKENKKEVIIRNNNYNFFNNSNNENNSED